MCTEYCSRASSLFYYCFYFVLLLECACDPIGTVDPGTGMLLCDRHSGQCQCKPGVAGRQCDKCDHLFINFGPNGCQSKSGMCICVCVCVYVWCVFVMKRDNLVLRIN